MTITPPNFAPEIFTLDAIVESVFAFENLLREKQASLELPPGSPIEVAGLAALEMLETFNRDLPYDSQHDDQQEWRQAVALGDMLRKVLLVRDHPCFDQLWPHVLLLLRNTNIALNLWNPVTDSDANKVFELYMALVVAPLCEDLALDDPDHSSGGKNPDVIANLDGLRWAFACKVMHSDSPQTFLDRVRDGIDQLERSDAGKGIVFTSLKNRLPHDGFWNMQADSTIWHLFASGPIHPEIGRRWFIRICDKYHKKVINELLGGPAGFIELFENTNTVPAVLLHLSSTICTWNQGEPNFHLMRMFAALTTDPLPADLHATLEKLNNSLHGRCAVAAPADTIHL